MKMNLDECHLLLVCHKFKQIDAKICSDLIWESNSAELLLIKIDNNLKFDKKCFPVMRQKQTENCLLVLDFKLLNFHQKRTLIKT